MTNYVIVGDSIAANSAAARIHDLDPNSPITMISREPDPYYSRCALMYYVMDHCDREDIYIAQKGHYERMNATKVFDEAIDVDVAAHRLICREGEYDYDKLLIACGAEDRLLAVENEDADGIYGFINLRDADAILHDLPHCEKAIVTGGGLIGAEAAEVFIECGIECDFYIRAPYYYHNFCSHEQSRIIEDRFRHHGVKMHLRRTIEGFEKDESGRVSAAIDSEGDRIPCDIAVRAIGVEPAIGWLENSAVEIDRGVIVNQRMENAAEDVWAAGDCVEVHYPDQAPEIVKLWYTARPMGWVAGENMASADGPGDAIYEEEQQYQTAMFTDLDFASYGEMPTEDNDLEPHNITAANEYDSVMLVHDGHIVVGCSVLGRALTMEDTEHIVDSQMPLADAIEACESVLTGGMYDRAPKNRIAKRDPLSRRPPLWPFGSERAQKGLWKLTGGF
ncbi:MAG: NAD(P)/FAD-dependent oxidoreductase [Armatimonadota bacterium]